MAMRDWFGVCLAIGLLRTSPVGGDKILLITAALHSHCQEVSAVGQELADNGHNVSISLVSNFEPKGCYSKLPTSQTNPIRPILFKSKPGVPSVADLSLNMTLFVEEDEFGYFAMMQNLEAYKNLVRINCLNIIWNAESIVALKKEKFDLVIIDGFFLAYCSFLIPYKLDVPYVTISTIFDDFITSRPALPSIMPGFMTKFTDDMTFVERLFNALNYVTMPLIAIWTMPMDIVAEIAPELSAQEVIKLMSKAELFLYNYDTVLSYPAPALPNHIYVGGIATTPAKPLSGDIKEFYSKAQGVVLITFGASFGLLPRRVETLLVSTLKKLKYSVIWKYLDEGRDGNILKSNWLPQNDLLGHRKTKLFISHCGNNGVFEALYHGVPILCTPIYGDQFFNAIRVQNWKAGSYINLIRSTDEELFSAITEILDNPIYSKNMKRASEMFHSRPMTPRQRAVFWIEHVLKFGGKHLRSRGSEMSVFTYLGYDVFLFVLGVLVITGVVTFKILLLCCRWFCKRQSKVKTS